LQFLSCMEPGNHGFGSAALKHINISVWNTQLSQFCAMPYTQNLRSSPEVSPISYLVLQGSKQSLTYTKHFAVFELQLIHIESAFSIIERYTGSFCSSTTLRPNTSRTEANVNFSQLPCFSLSQP
jgi:hypothetical protein